MNDGIGPGTLDLLWPACTARTRPAAVCRPTASQDRRRRGAPAQGQVIGCGCCFYTCPFGAPQRPAAFGARRWTNAPSAPAAQETSSTAELRSTAQPPRQGKLPLCAEILSTKALIAGDADVVAQHLPRGAMLRRGTGAPGVGLDAAYSGGEPGRAKAGTQAGGAVMSTGKLKSIALADAGRRCGCSTCRPAAGAAGHGIQTGPVPQQDRRPPWEGGEFKNPRGPGEGAQRSVSRSQTEFYAASSGRSSLTTLRVWEAAGSWLAVLLLAFMLWAATALLHGSGIQQYRGGPGRAPRSSTRSTATPVWRAVRSGEGTSPSRLRPRGGVLIQSEGQHLPSFATAVRSTAAGCSFSCLPAILLFLAGQGG